MQHKIKQAIGFMKDAFLNDDRPIYLAFSGGKDSTVLLSLFVQMLLSLAPSQRKRKRIYALFSNPQLEMPPVIQAIEDSISRFKAFAEEHDLPVEFHIVQPKEDDTFMVQVIGRGTPLPRNDARWCTFKWKINPMTEKINEVLERHGGYIALTGARKDESDERRKRLEANAVEPGSPMKHHTTSGCNLLCAIEDWTSGDVWTYIYSHASSWVDSNEIGRLYSEAAGDGDECTSMLEGQAGEKPGCSKSARYGCWVCPLFRGSDRTLTNLIEHYGYLAPMNDFRNWLVPYATGEWENVRDVYNHKEGFRRTPYDYENDRWQMTSPGGYNLNFRAEILRRLLDTEVKVKQTGEDRELISDSDLCRIQSMWLNEGDLNLSAMEIAEEHGRSIELSAKDAYVWKIANVLFASKQKGIWDGRLVKYYVNHHVTERWCVQFVKEILDKRGEEGIVEMLISLRDPKIDFEKYAVEHLTHAKMASGFYPSPDLESEIRREWEQDQRTFATKFWMEEAGFSVFVSDYDDPLDDPNISLEDKMGFMDTWRDYAGIDESDIGEYNGHFNVMKFKEAKTSAAVEKQLTFVFEAMTSTTFQDSTSRAQNVPTKITTVIKKVSHSQPSLF